MTDKSSAYGTGPAGYKDNPAIEEIAQCLPRNDPRARRRSRYVVRDHLSGLRGLEIIVMGDSERRRHGNASHAQFYAGTTAHGHRLMSCRGGANAWAEQRVRAYG